MLPYRLKRILKNSKQRYYHAFHNTILRNQPKILVNSIQKAGTHLLTNALNDSLPQRYIGRGAYNHCVSQLWPEETIQNRTTIDGTVNLIDNHYYPGEILHGHIEYNEELIQKLPTNLKRFLMVRHPLTVVLSLANWWERHDEIKTIPFLTYKKINNLDEKLEYLITGEYQGKKIWPSLVKRYEAYTGWLNESDTLVIKYEEMIDSPQSTFLKIQSFLNQEMNIDKFLKGMQPRKSKTFTKGEQKIFKVIPEELVDVFNKSGGEKVLKEYGY